MKKSYLFIQLLSGFFTVPAALLAVDSPRAPINLSEAISLGLAHSPRIEKAEAGKEEAAWKKTESWSGILPYISLEAQHSLAKKYQLLDIDFGGNPATIPQIFPTTNVSLNVAIPIFDGFRAFRKREAAVEESLAAENDLGWAKFRLEEEIRLRFNQVLAARALFSVADQNLKTASEHLQKVKALKRGGAATRVDVLRSEVQLSEAQNQLVEANDNLSFTTRKLFLTLGMPELDREVQGELAEPDAKKVETINWENETKRLDIVALKHRLESVDAIRGADSVFWVPKINLVGQYLKYNNKTDRIFDGSSTRDAYNVAVNLSWNVFDGLGSYARAKESIYRRVQAEKSLQESLQQAPVEFEFWKKRYLHGAAFYKTKVADVEKSEESLRLTQQGYRLGSRTNSEVLDSLLELFKTRAAVVNAKQACIESLINIEMVLGRRFSND